MASDTTSVRALIETLRARYPEVGSLDLRLHDCGARVHSNSRALLDVLSAYFHDFVANGATGEPEIVVTAIECPPIDTGHAYAAWPPGPGKMRVKDEYVDFPDGRLMRKRLTRMLFCFGAAGNVAAGACLENSNQVVNFVNNRFIQRQVDRGCLLCHAAGVARGGRGVGIAGYPGRGKSTLMLHLLDRGLDFVSNDRLLVRRSGAGLEMVGLAKLPRVNPGTILHNPRLAGLVTDEQRSRYAALPADQLWRLEDKYDVDVSRCFDPGGIRLHTTMAAQVILSWKPGGGGEPDFKRVNLGQRPDLLAALQKSVGAHHFTGPGLGPPLQPDEDYVRAFADTPVWEASGGVDFEAACELGAKLLE